MASYVFLLFIKNKQFFNTYAKILCQFVGEYKGRLITPVLQGDNGLPGHIYSQGQFALGNFIFFTVLLYFCLQIITSVSKCKVHCTIKV